MILLTAAKLAWNYRAIWSLNLDQFGLKTWQYGMEILANPIWPGNSGQSGLEIETVMGKYGLEILAKYGLNIRADLDPKSWTLWPGNLANLAWKTRPIWP